MIPFIIFEIFHVITCHRVFLDVPLCRFGLSNSIRFSQTTDQEQLSGFWKHVSLSDFVPWKSSWSLLHSFHTNPTKILDEQNWRLTKLNQPCPQHWWILNLLVHLIPITGHNGFLRWIWFNFCVSRNDKNQISTNRMRGHHPTSIILILFLWTDAPHKHGVDTLWIGWSVLFANSQYRSTPFLAWLSIS